MGSSPSMSSKVSPTNQHLPRRDSNGPHGPVAFAEDPVTHADTQKTRDQEELDRRIWQEDLAKRRQVTNPFNQKRSCTDCVWLILIVAFWGGMIYVAYMGYQRGSPARVVYGRDQLGNLCGVDNTSPSYVEDVCGKGVTSCASAMNLSGYRRVFFEQGYPNKGICVSNCPTDNTNVSSAFPADYPGRGVNQPTWYASRNIFFRCFPNALVDATLTEAQARIDSSLSNAADSARRAMGSLYQCWRVLAICAGIAMIISFVWIVLLRCTAGAFVYSTIILLIAGLGVSAWFLLDYSTTLSDDNTATGLSYFKNSKILFQVLGWTAAGLGALLLLISCFFLTRLRLTVALMALASRAVASVPMMMFFPIWMLIVEIGFTIFWIATCIFLMSAGQFDALTGNFTYDKTLAYLQLYHVFGYFWTSQFLWGVSFVVLSMTVSSWYFGTVGDDKEAPSFATWHSFWRTMRYHLGSIAFGSFIIAVVKLIRYLLAKLQARLKNSTNCCLKACLCCCQCCLWCFEKCLKFITKIAYVEVAMQGTSFCSGARMAFGLLTRNAATLMVVNLIGDLMIFFSKLCVTLLTALCGYFLLNVEKLADGVDGKVLPLAVICIIAYLVTSIFFSVYDTAIETLVICFLEDREQNNGTQEQPYYTPELLELFNKHNQKGVEDATKR